MCCLVLCSIVRAAWVTDYSSGEPVCAASDSMRDEGADWVTGWWGLPVMWWSNLGQFEVDDYCSDGYYDE